MFVTGQLWKGIIEHWRLGGAAQLWKGVGYRGREVLYAFGPGNKVKNNTKKVRSSQDKLQRKLFYHTVTCYTVQVVVVFIVDKSHEETKTISTDKCFINEKHHMSP